MSNIAIITARGGSKRIPRKNVKLFRGKPIIAYSIETALKSGLFDMVMVSTDDIEISKISVDCGAEVPFLRSQLNSDDHSTTSDVLVEVILALRGKGKNFTNGCCIYATAPFITVENLKRAHNTMIRDNLSSVFPVSAFNYPIYRGLKLNESGRIEMIWPENMNKRSQDLPPVYHDAGQFYWFQINSFLRDRILYTKNSGAIFLDDLHVQDIDNEFDWKLAELKYSILYPGG